MKLASIRLGNELTYGVLENENIKIPSPNFLKRYPDLKSLLASDAVKELDQNKTVVPLNEVVFEPVIPNPGKILCVGINFLAHMAEMGREPPDYPWIFVRFPDSQVGHEKPLRYPDVSDKFDFEGELAFVLGKKARRVRAEDALDYVAGYSCFMDGSIRDWQNHSSQFTPGKNFVSSGSFGPWLVTNDEIPDPSVLNLETRLNGQVMQKAAINDLKFDVSSLIEYCSTFTTLYPGDVISTGTPGGVGFARKPPVWLKPGDIIEVEIDKVGTLRNEVLAD